MFKNYLKIGWRNLLKNKGHSYINMSGLAVGMAVSTLIGVWVFDEISFNKNHLNYDRIAEVYQHKIVNDEIQTTVSPAQEYERKFSSEQRVGKLATTFALLAIFISCLGLFGLASFVAQQRTKEIGIRKVLGASVFSLWKMMSKDFVALIIISSIIAVPIAYYFLIEWLEQYEYRIEISWWIFALSSLVALSITLFTVSFQAIKAALANPVKSLRSE